MNETIKNLLERRSVRGYKEDLVPEEVLNEILEAGEYAPSGMGQQGTLMVVILSILVYTLFSRMFDLMQPPAVKHSIAVV